MHARFIEDDDIHSDGKKSRHMVFEENDQSLDHNSRIQFHLPVNAMEESDQNDHIEIDVHAPHMNDNL